MKIGIIVAMGGEFRLVEALLSGKKEQEIRGYRYVTVENWKSDIDRITIENPCKS